MADDRVFIPRPGYVPVLKAQEISIIACIKAFDAGCEHVYIVDEDGKYTGQAIDKAAFLTAWQTKTLQLRKLDAVPLELGERPEAVEKAVNEVVASYPECREIPLTRAGHIACVAVDKEPEPEEFKPEWGYAQQYMYAVFKDFKKVFVSSLENEHLRDFFYAALPVMGRKLMPLRQENLSEAMSAGNLLVFGADVYPPVTKCHVMYVHSRMHELAMKDMESRIHISSHVARIQEKDFRKPEKLIRAFDKGHKTVAVENEDGICQGIVMSHHFAQHFPARNYPLWGNLMLPYDEDADRLKHTVAAHMVGTARQGIPLTMDGKAVAMAVLENFTYRDMTERAMQKVQSVHWEYLSEDTVRNFFADKPRVLLSSLTGNLKSFYESFSSMLDLTVYSDDCLEDFLAGDYDVLLYEADLWGRCRSAKISIRDLYLLLVKREVEGR